MSLIEVNINHQVNASIRLDEATIRIVDQYAAMLRVPGDDVINATLAQTLPKCKDFQAFLKTPQAEQVRSSLRVRKVAAEPAGSSRKKPTPVTPIVTPAAASVAGSKA